MAKRPPLPPLDPPPYPFSKMDKNLEPAAKLFSKVYDKLYAADAREAARQLVRLDRPKLSIENLHFFEPEQVLQAFEEDVTHGTRVLALLRNLFALLPLLLTWIALSVATFLYQQELASDTTHQLYLQPFLSLWEASFGNSGLWKLFTFSNIALLDFGLLFIVLGLTILLHRSEAKAAKRSSEVSDLLDEAVQKLAELVQFSAPADPRSWAQQAQTVIDAAMRQIKNQADAGQRVMEATKQAIDGFEQKIQTALDQFSQGATQALTGTVSTNRTMIDQVSREAVQVLENALTGQKDVLKGQLEPVITRLSSAVGDFQSAGAALAGNVQSYVGSAASIDATLGKLTGAITTLDGSITRLDATQTTVGTQVAGAAGDMTRAVTGMAAATTSVDTLAKEITDKLEPSLTALAGQVTATGDALTGLYTNLADAGAKLEETARQLAWTAHHLTNVTMQLSSMISGGPPPTSGVTPPPPATFWQRFKGAFGF